MGKVADFFVKLYKTGLYKYIIVFAVFFAAMIFSKKHNIIQYLENKSTIESLEKEKQYYENETLKNRERLQELKSDKNDLEKFARERYHLKKADEDIFILTDE